MLLRPGIPVSQTGTLFSFGVVQPKAARFSVYLSVARRLSSQLIAQQDISTVTRAALPHQDRQMRPELLQRNIYDFHCSLIA